MLIFKEWVSDSGELGGCAFVLDIPLPSHVAKNGMMGGHVRSFLKAFDWSKEASWREMK
jgi:hypothetical protein